jgi:acetyl esterase
MPLHPVIQAALFSAAGSAPYHALPIAQARAQARQGYPRVDPPLAVGAVHDLRISGPGGPMGLRIYRPHGDGPHPVIVFFHGSGFVVLDLDSHDDICRRLCRGASCMVVSVDYRLAPEHKFPAAPDDCLAATRWVAEHADAFGGDATRMVVAGDSAGGCLAAVTALRIRDEGGPALQGQLMWYPVTDYPTRPPDSYGTYGAGYGLTHEGMLWFWEQYLSGPAAASHAHASPLRMDTPVGLPSTYIMVAEFDVLRDEGEAFARRLTESGIETVIRCEAGMNHGFLKYTGVIEEADAAMDDACAWLKRVLRIETSGADA